MLPRQLPDQLVTLTRQAARSASEVDIATGKKAAGKALGSEASTSIERSVAAFDLSQDKNDGKTQIIPDDTQLHFLPPGEGSGGLGTAWRDGCDVMPYYETLP